MFIWIDVLCSIYGPSLMGNPQQLQAAVLVVPAVFGKYLVVKLITLRCLDVALAINLVH